MSEYYFLNVVTDNIEKVAIFCKSVEELNNSEILSGINFAETFDNKYLLGFVFTKKYIRDMWLNTSEKMDFLKVYTEEERWTDILPQTKLCIIGNFSHKLLEKIK